MHQIQPSQLARWLEAASADAHAATDADEGPGFHAPGAHEHVHTAGGEHHVPVKAPLVLDVREDWEAQICGLPGSLHIPMRQIPSRLHEIVDAQRPVVCYCHHGMRSMQVAMFLEHRGVAEVYNLVGGIDAWARQIDTSCATY